MVRPHEWSASRGLSRGVVRWHRPWWASQPAPIGPPVRLTVESTGAHVVVLAVGDLGALTDPQLEALAAEHPLVGCVVLDLDLAEVPSLGSAGVAVLQRVRRWCDQRGLELRLSRAAPSVERVLQLAGLDALAGDGGGQRPPVQELVLF
jgi:anti-anti-sigma factor